MDLRGAASWEFEAQKAVAATEPANGSASLASTQFAANVVLPLQSSKGAAVEVDGPVKAGVAEMTLLLEPSEGLLGLSFCGDGGGSVNPTRPGPSKV